jgi:hypothetical protein
MLHNGANRGEGGSDVRKKASGLSCGISSIVSVNRLPAYPALRKKLWHGSINLQKIKYKLNLPYVFTVELIFILSGWQTPFKNGSYENWRIV